MTSVITRPTATGTTRGLTGPARPSPRGPRGPRDPRRQRGALGALGVGATITLAATTVASAAGLIRVFPDWSFLPSMVVIALAVHLLCLLGRVRGWRLWSVGMLAVPLIAILVGVLYLPQTMTAVVIPSRATWDAAWQQIADAFSQFRVAVTPVPSTGGYAIACALAIGGVAFLADAFAFRAFGRLEAVVPGGLLFVVASAVGYDRARVASTAWWLASAVVAVAWLRAEFGERDTGWFGDPGTTRLSGLTVASAGTALAIAVSAALVGPSLPGAGAPALIDTRHGQGGSTQVVSPLVDIQGRLVNRANVELFTVRSGSPAYWRLTALESFDGRQWRQHKDYSDNAALARPGAVSGIVQRIEIASLGSIWLPAAFRPVGLASDITTKFNAESSSIIRSAGDLFTGLRYEVVSVPAATTAEELAAASSTGAPDAYYELPDDFPDDLRSFAQAIAGDAPNAYVQALTLQDYFRDNFRYEVNVPRGHSDRAMETFLRMRAGYCEQFAGTFAALGRALGLATRVAVGFTPGDVDSAGVYHVRGKHAHAWPEVFFDGIGWVPFEPTPGRGAPDAEGYTGVRPAQDGGVFSGPPATVPGGATGDDRSAPAATAPVPDVPRRDPEAAPGGRAEPAAPVPTLPDQPVKGGRALGVGAVVLLVLGAAVLWFVAMRPVLRLIRRRRASSPAQRLVESWRRVIIALAASGAPRRAAETPLEYAERAWKMTGCDRAVVRRIAELVTGAAYGAGDPSEEAADEGERLAGQLVRVLDRRATMAQRLVRRIDPRQV